MLETIKIPILLQDLGQIKYGTQGKKSRYGIYRCECGSEFKSRTTDIKNGHTKSCGCHNIATIIKRNTTHGLTKHPIFSVWKGMLKRTTNKNEPSYKNYGGRGITVCDEWLNNFKAFYDDMVEAYQKGLTIDRIDNDKGYSKENCRWTTYKVQMRNTRRIHSTNTSGYRGVSYYKRYGNWVSQISVSGKKKNLGYHTTALDAAIAYDKYVIENGLEHTKNGVISQNELP